MIKDKTSEQSSDVLNEDFGQQSDQTSTSIKQGKLFCIVFIT